MSEDLRQEPSDWHSYTLLLSRKTLTFLAASLDYYVGLLEAENTAILEDSHLLAFLGTDTEDDSEVDGEVGQARSMSELLKRKLQEEGSQYRVFISISHKSVRYLKSIGLLYLGFLKQRRNECSKRPNLSKRLLAKLDREITSREELLTSEGVFANATEIPLLVDQSLASGHADLIDESASESVVRARRPSPIIVESIELLDEELRVRCIDLYAQFRDTGQPERFDTVVTEATRVLENRLREATGLQGTGMELASRAFGRDPLLRVSHIAAEQEGAHALFRGIFGLVRNRVHHRLHPDMVPERVMQILGIIDYLLFLIGASEREEKK